MRVVLISTYEMGRQPFGLASPAAWLRQAGATVVCQDLSRSRLDREAIVPPMWSRSMSPCILRRALPRMWCSTSKR